MSDDYDIDGLTRGIDACKRNIETFEQAIEKERQTIKEYKIMIDHLKEKAKRPKDIVIEVDRGNSNNRSSS